MSTARSWRFWGWAALPALALGGWFWQSHTVAQVTNAPAAQAAKREANELSKAFRAASEAILPTVVTIETSTKPKMVRGNANPKFKNGENPFKGTPFENFFNDEQFRQFGGNGQFGNPAERQPRSSGAGSGVIIDSSGIVLTNNHVVSGADVVTVRLADGREFKGTDIKTDPQSDLAIVRIENAGKLPAAKLGDSDDMQIGDWVIAVGNPFGLEQTVSAGIISGKQRSIGAAQRAQFLQTDAAINPGNSGGPLVNLNGEVIGINTAIASNGGGNDGIGFAVPSNLAKWITPQLMKGGMVQRAYLGVGIERMNTQLASQFGTSHREGVLVTEVFPGTPAEEAGLKEGDVIVDFAGSKVHTERELQEVVERAELGAKHKASVLRDGKPMTVEIVARALPKDFGRAAADRSQAEEKEEPKANSAESKELGLELSDLSDSHAAQLGFEGYHGVLVTQVDPDGPAYAAGVREGMLIRKVGREDVTSVEEFRKALEKLPLKDGVLLLLRTQSGNRYVVVEGL